MPGPISPTTDGWVPAFAGMTLSEGLLGVFTFEFLIRHADKTVRHPGGLVSELGSKPSSMRTFLPRTEPQADSL